MNLETAKSFILTVLVGISLLLTLGLWNYQPNDTLLNDQEEVDMDIGGSEVTQQEIVEPESIIFHQFNKHYGFTDPSKRQSLYQDMQKWVLYNMEIMNANGAPANDYQVEVTFPDALPMGIITKIFKLNDDNTYLPDWSFNRMFITFIPDSKALRLQFLSENGQKKAVANVNDSKKYNLLWSYLTEHEDLEEYIAWDESETPIYIPSGSRELTQRSFTVSTINIDKLVNALFNKPSIVSRANKGEPYFSDSQSGMRLLQDGKLMKFDSPISSNYERMNQLDVLNYSIKNINEHKGWTGISNVQEGWRSEYNLEKLDLASNRLLYRMFYNGYAVYNGSALSTIEQEWHNLSLSQYQRPMFSLNSTLGGETLELQSGQSVIAFLQNNPKYNLDQISDIKIGYDLTVQESTSIKYYVRLEPAWFVNESGSWKELDFGDEIPLNKGGS
ncbi:YycH family regulatory protein [Virgibacillus oceani]|uniref:Regulatory protein YycH domain-containing protein n=1 Tax=Virgibacillus oceani TaxID=1479511 RepID=A0A917HED1_9BACI|nr:two-component system activity regulator YycH [Virgibacillus oceani]GGG76506.1 hypothetical protein GCM10011398_21840 [Virgibacillus oceani]